MPRPKDSHEIRMPGKVLDQIRTKEESGEYGKDSRFARKRKAHGKPVSRKDKRKEERQLKKQKQSKSHQTSLKETQKKVSENRHTIHNVAEKQIKQNKHNEHPKDPLAALKALKAKKNQEKGRKEESELKIVRESDLEDDVGSSADDFNSGDEDFANFSDEKPLERSDIRIVKEDELEDEEDDSDFDSDFESDDLADFDDDDAEEDAKSVFEKLKQKKLEKRNLDKEKENVNGCDSSEESFGSEFEDEEKDDEDPLAKLKALKEAKKMGSKTVSSKTKTEKPKERVIEANFTEDNLDRDLEYYAKKLGLKDGKKSRLTKLDDDDFVGGLLDGLDLEFSDENAHEDRNEESEGDFGGDSDEFSEDFSGGSDSEGEIDRKENPFVAPVVEHESEDEKSEAESKPKKYIPPAMRRKLAMESSGISAEIMALQKSIKGPINKLSEANIGSIVNEINGLFLSNPRQAVNENLTSIVMDSVIQQGRLLDTFVYLHSAFIVAIFRTQGVDFGAHFIQTLVEKLESCRLDASMSKQALNTASLLSSVYSFQLVSSKLLYDVIKDLIVNLTESNAEILLKIIRTSGNQMRADDPSALKEIVLQMNKSASSLSKINPRMQFLIDTIASLKNNKLKLENESSHQMTVRLKKFLGTFTSGKTADPLQVTLDDIRNIDTKGKWWLVGSAWKGADEKNEVLANIEMVNDVLDSAEPNWIELARAQRMNTDIRRAIFISIMSANDYIDAVTKLDKLALKKAQEREIPRIVVHCAVVEPAWNPYYGILAAKLCDSHSYRKTFQFMLWDLVKGFEGITDEEDEEEAFAGFDDSESDDDKLKKILNLGRLFGYLFAEGALALHMLRTVNFISASPDIKLFMEVLLVTFLDKIGKKSQVNAIGVGLVEKRGMSEVKFDDRTLIERLLKAKDEPALLKGIKLFISRNLRSSDFVTGKKQRKRIEWGIRSMVDIIDEFVKETEF